METVNKNIQFNNTISIRFQLLPLFHLTNLYFSFKINMPVPYHHQVIVIVK